MQNKKFKTIIILEKHTDGLSLAFANELQKQLELIENGRLHIKLFNETPRLRDSESLDIVNKLEYEVSKRVGINKSPRSLTNKSNNSTIALESSNDSKKLRALRTILTGLRDLGYNEIEEDQKTIKDILDQLKRIEKLYNNDVYKYCEEKLKKMFRENIQEAIEEIDKNREVEMVKTVKENNGDIKIIVCGGNHAQRISELLSSNSIQIQPYRFDSRDELKKSEFEKRNSSSSSDEDLEIDYNDKFYSNKYSIYKNEYLKDVLFVKVGKNQETLKESTSVFVKEFIELVSEKSEISKDVRLNPEIQENKSLQYNSLETFKKKFQET